jgi:hypothetical protein
VNDSGRDDPGKNVVISDELCNRMIKPHMEYGKKMLTGSLRTG